MSENANKKQVMVVTDIIRGLCVLSIAVLFYLELLQPWMLIITSLLISSAEAFRISASSAVLVQILKKEELDFGISLNFSVSRAVELVGLGLASFIIAQLGIAAAIMNSAGSSAIPVISFALSIGTGFVTTRNIFIFIGVLLVVLMAVLARVLEIDTEEKE